MSEASFILVVDDHAPLAENLVEILQDAGYQARMTDSAEGALRFCDERCLANLIITDFKLPGLSGAHLISALRRRGITAPAVVISAFTDERTRAEAHAAGAVAVLAKPLNIAQLLTHVQSLTSPAPPST